MTNQSGAALRQKTFIPALPDTTTTHPRGRRRIPNPSGPRARRIRTRGVRPLDRRLPPSQNDIGGDDPWRSSQKSDLAFQRAMQSATARGLEHPPRMGVFKDNRPLNAPQLFEPIPHSSGCTSPAFECAELMEQKEVPHSG